MIVADATPLVHLARAGLVDLLPKLYRHVLVPTGVWAEVTERVPPRAEAHVLRDVRSTWLEVRKLAPRMRKMSEGLRAGAPVGLGEAEAIVLAEGLRAPILMDDRVAVDLARMRGLETHWTTSVVLEAHHGGILDRRAAHRAIEDLVASGLWIRQDVLLRILSVLAER